MRRPGFTTKLVIGLVVIGVLLVGAMAAASRWSFQQRFTSYLTKVDAQRAAPLVRTLTAAYARHGSWDFLRRDPAVWRRMVANLFHPRPGPDAGPNAGAGIGGGRPGPPDRFDGAPIRFGDQPAPPPPPPSRPALPDDTGLHNRLRLLDAAQQRVIGPPDRGHTGHLEPLKVGGKVVGWLSISPLPLHQDLISATFRQQQLRAFSWIALGALLLTPLLAFGLGRYLLRPLRSLTGATRALASGNYATRVPVETRDDLGRLAADFNQLAAALERNERLRREAMADVSHELRTPLSLLRAEIEALQDGVRTCDAQRLGSLHATVQGLSRLVDDLYQLTLADAGALDYRKEACDGGEVIRDAGAAVADALAARGLTLEVDVKGPLPLDADPRRLRQLLDNLLKNSIRYTDSGGRVVVRGRREGQRITIEVEDSAPGVEPALLPRLFDRFYRVEKSRSRARGGAGLGLAIGKSIVEAHGGSITAAPSPLGGVAIVVTLPAAGESPLPMSREEQA